LLDNNIQKADTFHTSVEPLRNARFYKSS